MKLKHDTAYYYADGSTVPLERTDQVAVDLETAETAQLSPDALSQLQARGRPIRGSLIVLDTAAIPSHTAKKLETAGALRPVYTTVDGVTLIVLPEVRVEVTSEEEEQKLRRFLKASEANAEILQQRPKQLRILLDPAKGADTLRLANSIEEELHPAMTQARFIRILPRPGVNS